MRTSKDNPRSASVDRDLNFPAADLPRQPESIEATLDDWSDDDDDCGCSSLLIDPNAAQLTFTPLTGGLGFGEDADFTNSVLLRLNLPPCSSTAIFPAPPPPAATPFHSRCVADTGPVPVFWTILWARVHCTFTATYKVLPKPDCEDCAGVDIDLDATLSAFQQAQGRGYALAIATAYLEIEPFHQPINGVTLGQPVTPPAPFGIDWDSPRQAFKIGGAFVKPYSRRAWVPFGVPQNILVRTMTYARARLRVRSEARIDKLEFKLSGPDPKGGGAKIKIKGKISRVERRTGPSSPKPAAGYALRRIPVRPGGTIATSIAVHAGRLFLASTDGRNSLVREVNIRSGKSRVAHRLSRKIVPRIRTLPDESGAALAALTYPAGSFDDGSRRSNAKLISLSSGTMAGLLDRLDLPADFAAVRAGKTHSIAVAECGAGAVLQARDRRVRTAIHGLHGPQAVAVPPANSRWSGLLYIADTAMKTSQGRTAAEGRILEIRRGRQKPKSLFAGPGISALAFTGKRFGDVLAVAVYNQPEPEIDSPEPDTGSILMIDRPGRHSVIATFVDAPRDLAVLPNGNLVFLGGQGLFEINPKRGRS